MPFQVTDQRTGLAVEVFATRREAEGFLDRLYSRPISTFWVDDAFDRHWTLDTCDRVCALRRKKGGFIFHWVYLSGPREGKAICGERLIYPRGVWVAPLMVGLAPEKCPDCLALKTKLEGVAFLDS